MIADTSQIEEVFLTSRGPLYITSKGFGGIKEDPYSDWLLHLKGEEPFTRKNIEVFELGLRKTLKVLTNAGKKVVFVFDAPELGFHVKACVSERYYFPTKDVRAPCSLSRIDYDRRVGSFKEMVMSVLVDYPSVQTVDQADALCDSNRCLGSANGRLYYRDDDRLNEYGAKYVVKRLEKEFRALYQ